MHGHLSYSKSGWFLLAVSFFLVVGIGFTMSGSHVNASGKGADAVTKTSAE